MINTPATAGVTTLTASGDLGSPANRPVMVMGIAVNSKASGGVVTLKNNGSSGTLQYTATGTANKTVSPNFPGSGIYFPNGCYVTIDVNTNAAVISWTQVVST